MQPDVLAVLTAALPTTAWLLAVAAAFVTLDAVLPVLPSETALVSVGVLASTGVFSVQASLVALAAAAFAGDLLAFGLGRSAAPRWERLRATATRRGAVMRGASAALGRYGVGLVASARFVPAGRTAVTVSAGASGMPMPVFVLGAVVGSVAWATAFTLTGYLGGLAFADNPAIGLLVGLGVVALVALLTEVVRQTRHDEPSSPTATAAEPTVTVDAG
jgi:membrane protein DedA with SNARE-associated domain